MGDRRYVLNGLNSIVEVDTTATDQSEATEKILKKEEITKYQCREHTACIRADNAGSIINWHLGVVDRYDYDKDEHFVLYIRRTYAKGTQ